MYHEISVLKQAGLTVEQRSPWHFQVMSNPLINVCLTKRKWMVQYDTGASFYNDAADLLRIVTEKTAGAVPQGMPPMTDAEHEWRDGLNELAYEISTVYYQLAKAIM